MAELKRLSVTAFLLDRMLKISSYFRDKDHNPIEANEELKKIRAKITLIENEIGELDDMDIPLKEIDNLLEALSHMDFTIAVEKIEAYLISLRENIRIQ